MLATDHTKVLQWRPRVVSLPVSVLTATVNIGYFISDGLIQSYLPGWIYVSDRFCLQFLISSLYCANVPWLFRIMNHLHYEYDRLLYHKLFDFNGPRLASTDPKRCLGGGSESSRCWNLSPKPLSISDTCYLMVQSIIYILFWACYGMQYLRCLLHQWIMSLSICCSALSLSLFTNSLSLFSLQIFVVNTCTNV